MGLMSIINQLLWVQSLGIDSIVYNYIKINHIPKASHNLGLKIPMLNLLREQHCQDVLPKTYRLD